MASAIGASSVPVGCFLKAAGLRAFAALLKLVVLVELVADAEAA